MAPHRVTEVEEVQWTGAGRVGIVLVQVVVLQCEGDSELGQLPVDVVRRVLRLEQRQPGAEQHLRVLDQKALQLRVLDHDPGEGSLVAAEFVHGRPAVRTEQPATLGVDRDRVQHLARRHPGDLLLAARNSSPIAAMLPVLQRRSLCKGSMATGRGASRSGGGWKDGAEP